MRRGSRDEGRTTTVENSSFEIARDFKSTLGLAQQAQKVILQQQ
jgi:hypothetical protein